MKQKNSFKQYCSNLVQRGFPALYKGWQRFRHLVNTHPRRSIAIMMAIVVLNVTALFCFTDSFKAISFSYSTIKAHWNDSTDGQVPDMGIPFTWDNYREMKLLQDTLSYLAAKPHRTPDDTLIMLRLFQRIEKLDPGFFNAINAQLYAKDSSK